VKSGVGLTRFKISQADGQMIKDLERTQGHDVALAELLCVLRLKSSQRSRPPQHDAADSSRPSSQLNLTILI
jgi:hypothetical protein